MCLSDYCACGEDELAKCQCRILSAFFHDCAASFDEVVEWKQGSGCEAEPDTCAVGQFFKGCFFEGNASHFDFVGEKKTHFGKFPQKCFPNDNIELTLLIARV